MGRLVLREVLSSDDLVLHAATTRRSSTLAGADAGELCGVGRREVPILEELEALRGADVVIDFSHPLHFPEVAAAVDSALVTGTTGLDAHGEQALREASARMPVLWATNFSTGVAILNHLVSRAASLVPEWDAEVVESHHRRKVDAPSGTARTLVDAIEHGRGEGATHVHGREGLVGERPVGDIGVHALRLGDVVGEHTVSFGGSGEVLHLGHSAIERRVFAVGAVRAARWLAGRAPGSYRFAQVVGLE
ncbi:MAG: 4-hydroxy-tetrahydrodipicolinate reductase [Deltaproteobacteria bacterium]|nr:MAG: 4-hydroxy-tetrahydrodipicolinate reductase [Deltaproteobacteria bacterium]